MLDKDRILPDYSEDVTKHGCAVYFDLMRLCSCTALLLTL